MIFSVACMIRVQSHIRMSSSMCHTICVSFLSRSRYTCACLHVCTYECTHSFCVYKHAQVWVQYNAETQLYIWVIEQAWMIHCHTSESHVCKSRNPHENQLMRMSYDKYERIYPTSCHMYERMRRKNTSECMCHVTNSIFLWTYMYMYIRDK